MVRRYLSAIAVLGVCIVSTLPSAAVESPQLNIINGSEETIDIFQQESEGKRCANGIIQPGKSELISTVLGNRFVIVGREDKVEDEVTCKVPIQGFRFDPIAKDGIPAFYTQIQRVRSFPIVASAKVNPYAL